MERFTRNHLMQGLVLALLDKGVTEIDDPDKRFQEKLIALFPSVQEYCAEHDLKLDFRIKDSFSGGSETVSDGLYHLLSRGYTTIDFPSCTPMRLLPSYQNDFYLAHRDLFKDLASKFME